MQQQLVEEPRAPGVGRERLCGRQPECTKLSRIGKLGGSKGISSAHEGSPRRSVKTPPCACPCSLPPPRRLAAALAPAHRRE